MDHDQFDAFFGSEQTLRKGEHMATRRFATVLHFLRGRFSRRTAVRGTGMLAVLALAGGAGATQARQATPTPGATAGVDPDWYAVVRLGRLREGASTTEVARRAREGFVPIIKTVPGFVAYFVIDTGQREQVTISIFSDPAGAAESTRRAAAWVPGAIGELVEGPAEVLADGRVQAYAVEDTLAGTLPEPCPMG
jgi:hypothetical protein